MPAWRRWAKWGLLLLLLTMVFSLVLVWQTGWLAQLYYQLSIPGSQSSHGAVDRLGLADYQVSIDARPIEGIADDASGLTFHPQRKTLFTVLNHPPHIVELDTQGRLLRKIPVRGASDLEGITHVEGDYFVITDEASHQLYRVVVSDGTREIDVSSAPRFGLGLGIGKRKNVGYEGVSWDHVNHRLLVVKEKNPLRVFAISGLRDLLGSGRFDLQIDEWRPAGSAPLMMTDLSSLTYHEPTAHLLLLSDESRLVVEFDEDGYPVGLLALRAGWHGLRKTVPQAEGLAVGEDGALYVLSEPNLFYRFEPPRPAQPASSAGLSQ